MEASSIIELIRCTNCSNSNQKEITSQLAKFVAKPYYPILANLVNIAIENRSKINNYDRVK